MSQRILTLKVDLSHPLVVHPIPGILGGGDCYADIIRVLVYQDGEPVQVTGTVTGYVMNQAGDTFTVSGAADGNGAQIQLPETAYELTGPITVAIRETRGTVRTTLAICSTAVKATTTGTEYDPGDMVPNIDNLREAWERAEAAAVAAEQKVQDFNDIILVQSAEPSSETNRIWVQPQSDEYKVPTWEEFSALRNGYVSFGTAAKAYYNLGTSYPVGSTIGEKVTGGTYQHYIIELDDVAPGETFSIATQDGATARPWAVLDANRVILAKSGTSASYSGTVTIPENGAVLIVQCRSEFIGTAHCIRNTNVFSLGNGVSSHSTAIAEIERRVRREKGTVYLGAGNTVDITVSGSSLVLTFSGRLCFKLLGDNAGVTDWEDISANLTSSQITIDGQTAVITMGSYKWLVYNTDDKQLYIRDNNGSGNYGLLANDVVLLYNAAGQAVHGILHEKWLHQQATEAEDRFDAAEARLDALEGSTDVSTTMTALTAAQAAAGQSDTFLYFTDPHLSEGTGWESRFKTWMSNLSAIKSSLPVAFTVCGGDWIGKNDTKQEALNKAGNVVATMRSKFSPFHMCVGNHDLNEQGAESITMAQMANIWYNGKETYYWFDTDLARYFVLNTGMDNSGAGYVGEEEWLCQQLVANTKRNVVFFQHILYKAGTTTVDGNDYITGGTVQTVAGVFLDIAAAYNSKGTYSINGNTYNFASAAGKVAFVLCGHNHRDGDVVINGIPVIIRTSLLYKYKTATTTMTYDLVVADFTSRKVNFVRVGRGNSKSIDMTAVS